MQIETIKDILVWTQQFHQYLSQCLIHCASKNESERAKMVLEYLSEHEKALNSVISQFESISQAHVLNTWCVEYLNKQPIVQHIHCNAPFSQLNAEQITDIVIEQHQQVIDLYRYLLLKMEIPEAVELIEKLLSVEEHEAMKMVTSSNRFSDL
jgi:uncharacterized protein (DUF305 family)